MIESQKLSVLLRLLKLKLSRLHRDQGPASRRNALVALGAVLRRLRARALEEYPAPPRKTSKARPRKKLNEWKVRKSVGTVIASKLQAAGIKVQVNPIGMFAPAWAVTLVGKFSASKIRAANRSIATRRALLAELSLRADALANGER